MQMSKEIIYSIIVPAYNEEDFLKKTLTSIQIAMNNIKIAGEVIVVDNDSTDKTADIAKEFKTHIVFEKKHQISKVRNTGAKYAKGKYLIFIDADTQINPDLLGTALDNLENGKCAGGGSIVCMDKELSFIIGLIIKLWNFLAIKFNLAAGAFIYCLKDGFEEINGFNETVYASEEIWFIKNLKKWAKKKELSITIIKSFPIITSARKLDWYSNTRLFFFSFILLSFPFAVKYKSLCSLWYKRPKK